MSDWSVFLSKTGVVNNLKNISTPIEKTEAKKSDNKSISSEAKVVLTGLGASAAIAAGIIAIRKGQAAKAIKEVGIDTFKEAGNKFVKGKAFTKDGKPFSGVISMLTKNGLEKRTMTYKDGVLQEVKVYQKVEIKRG